MFELSGSLQYMQYEILRCNTVDLEVFYLSNTRFEDEFVSHLSHMQYVQQVRLISTAFRSNMDNDE